MSTTRHRDPTPTHPASPAAMMCRVSAVAAAGSTQAPAADAGRVAGFGAQVPQAGIAPLYVWAYQAAVARMAADEFHRAGEAFVRAVAASN